jgi:hypothetical protein
MIPGYPQLTSPLGLVLVSVEVKVMARWRDLTIFEEEEGICPKAKKDEYRSAARFCFIYQLKGILPLATAAWF